MSRQNKVGSGSQGETSEKTKSSKSKATVTNESAESTVLEASQVATREDNSSRCISSFALSRSKISYSELQPGMIVLKGGGKGNVWAPVLSDVFLGFTRGTEIVAKFAVPELSYDLRMKYYKGGITSLLERVPSGVKPTFFSSQAYADRDVLVVAEFSRDDTVRALIQKAYALAARMEKALDKDEKTYVFNEEGMPTSLKKGLKIVYYDVEALCVLLPLNTQTDHEYLKGVIAYIDSYPKEREWLEQILEQSKILERVTELYASEVLNASKTSASKKQKAVV